MALHATIAGPYGMTHRPRNTGTTYSTGETKDGFVIRWKFSKHLIKGTAWAETVVDAVYQGGEVFLDFVSVQAYHMAFHTSWSQLGWPYSTVTGRIGYIGAMDVGSGFTGATVLTAISDTTAAEVLSPATFTAMESVIREDHEVTSNLNSRLRVVPISMRLFPYDTGSSNYGYFSYT